MIVKTPQILEPWYIDNIKRTMIKIVNLYHMYFSNEFSHMYFFFPFLSSLLAIIGKKLNLLPKHDSITSPPFIYIKIVRNSIISFTYQTKPITFSLESTFSEQELQAILVYRRVLDPEQTVVNACHSKSQPPKIAYRGSERVFIKRRKVLETKLG